VPRPLVIFDLDGTLVDSRDDIAAAVNRSLREMGEGRHSEDTIRGWIGGGVSRLLERALGGPEKVDEARALFDRYYGAGLLDRTRPYSGLDGLVRELSGTAVVAVATNKPGFMARRIVDGLGWGNVFRSVIGARDGFELKPDPGMLQELVRTSGTLGDRAVMVGDMVVDLETARAAGVGFVGVDWGYGPADALSAAGAPRIASSAEELRAVILNHFS
jgi:phosphoglycolate phosphatase